MDGRTSLRVRLRPDLIAVRIPTERGTQWHLKDPISLQFYLFDEHEYGLLQLLDGRRSVGTILGQFRAAYAPSYLSGPQLISFLDEARRKGLLLIDGAITTEQDESRGGPEDQRGNSPGGSSSFGGGESLVPRLMRWSNVLSLRLPGIDPDRALDAIYPFIRGAFTKTTALLVVLLVLLAIGLLTLRFDQFVEALPTQQAFFTPQTLIWLAVAIGVTKVLHELAHAFTCKHFGGDCHELGIMFLVFIPCLYCNVSDSWLLARRRDRMLITAAGILMEVGLASLATLVWWFTVDGPLRMVAMSVMLVGFVSTLTLNGNPLMRYDGYYLLSDWLRIPNLGSESSRVLREIWRRWGLGINGSGPVRTTERRALLATYGVASFCYRLFVIAIILVAIQAFGRAMQMRILASVVSLITLLGLVLPLAHAIVTPLSSRHDRRRIRPAHLGVVLSILVGLIAAGLFIPVPRSLYAPFVVTTDQSERLFVTVPGTLTTVLPVGSHVKVGEVVGRLDNPELYRRRLSMEMQQQQLKSQLETLVSQRLDEKRGATNIPALEKSIEDVTTQLTVLHEQLERLTLLAPRDGVVLPPPNVPIRSPQPGELPVWTGSPLDPENVGSTLAAGTLLCLIGDLHDVTATLYVAEEDLSFVRRGQAVTLCLDSSADHSVTGQVIEVSTATVTTIPRELAATQALLVDPQSREEPRPLTTVYRVRVSFGEGGRATHPTQTSMDAKSSTVVQSNGRLTPLPGLGECGTARISVAPEPLLIRVWRSFRRTFHFGGTR